MEPTYWQPSDGERLKFMRHAAGFDIQKFAKINSISVAQLKLLEDGGDSLLFYSPAIKASVGRKLLNRLGDKNVPGLTPQAPQVAADIANNPIDQQAPRMGADEALKIETLQTLDRVATNSVRDLQSDLAKRTETASGSPGRRQWYLVGLLAAVALAVTGNAKLDDFLQLMANTLHPPHRPEPADAAVKKIEPEQTFSAPVTASTTDASQVNPSVAAIAPAPEPVRVEPVAVRDQQSECRWSDQEVELQPGSVRTPGNYVHFVAKADATVCVLDGNKNPSVLSLKAGDAKSVRGAQPWHVSSNKLAELKVFYQGYQVPILDAKTTHIGLKER